MNKNYTMLLQNNMSKKAYSFNLINTSTSKVSYKFDFSMPEEASFGEYNYLLFDNEGLHPVTISSVLSKSILHTPDGDVIVGDLLSCLGIIKYESGVVIPRDVYDKKIEYTTYEG